MDPFEKTVRELIAPRHLQYVEIDGKKTLCVSEAGLRELMEKRVAETGPNSVASKFRDWMETTVFPSLAKSKKSSYN
jgi:prophage antirepressor-like protein